MAVNQTTLRDEDGESSDWIEIYNGRNTAVDLNGWSLTDDPLTPHKWRFPGVEIGAGKFVVVFASEKDRRDPASELHTNFSLLSSGEFLALVGPGSTLESFYGPGYPTQHADLSLGFAMETSSRHLLGAKSTAHYHVPMSDALGLSWTAVDFDDAKWETGSAAIGFDRKDKPTLDGLIQTDVDEVAGAASAAIYLRIPFETGATPRAQLQMRYADGFVAYVNGVEVARRNLSGRSVSFRSRAAGRRSEEEILARDLIPVPDGLLRAGRNVLAIHAFNARLSPEFLILPEVETREIDAVRTERPSFFAVPTLGWPNAAGTPGVAEAASFSQPSGVYAEPVTLELGVRSKTAVIRQTLDGSEPTEESDAYAGPISIDTPTMVNAKVFEPGLLPGLTVSHGYVMLGEEVRDFDSNLPLVAVSTFGSSIADAFIPAYIVVVDRGANGRSSITGPAHFAGNCGLKVRGSSTAGRPKSSYALEIWDEPGHRTGNCKPREIREKDVALLGLPAESDWILYGAYNFDRALIRNPLIYELSNQAGRYAARSRFCEVFVNTRGRAVSGADYLGVYSFMEKLDREPTRIDVERLPPEYDSEPLIAGGYIMKIDRLDPCDSGFSAGRQNFAYVYPKERDITPPQAAWIRTYIDECNAALTRGNFSEVYARYIDADSWIDHHLLNELTKNPDAFVLSTYLFKKRYGKLEAGPIWDFDRSMGPDDDNRAQNPIGWSGNDSRGWWPRLFADDEFTLRHRSRWAELRAGPLSTGNIHAVIDSMAAEIEEAQVRNFERWAALGRATRWQEEIDHLKAWLADRAAWMDRELTVPPTFDRPGGLVSESFELSITSLIGEAYYTLNGPDPMLGSGEPHAEAIAYAGPITIAENTRVRARSRLSAGVWSDIVQASYFFDILPLVVTEIMYQPPEDPEGERSHRDFIFLEFQNVGDERIDLTGVHFDDPAGGLFFDFTEGDVTSLGPKEHVVVVRSREGFASRYGAGIPVAGTFSGFFRQSIRLLGPVDEPLLVCRFFSSWYPSTDGKGFSLVIRDPTAPRESWNEKESWRPSLEVGGSPGRADTAIEEGLQLPGDINQDQRLNIGDVVGLLRHLVGGVSNPPCDSAEANRELLDVNGDDALSLADALYILNYLFRTGDPPVGGVDCIRIAGCPDSCKK